MYSSRAVTADRDVAFVLLKRWPDTCSTAFKANRTAASRPSNPNMVVREVEHGSRYHVSQPESRNRAIPCVRSIDARRCAGAFRFGVFPVLDGGLTLRKVPKFPSSESSCCSLLLDCRDRDRLLTLYSLFALSLFLFLDDKNAGSVRNLAGLLSVQGHRLSKSFERGCLGGVRDA